MSGETGFVAHHIPHGDEIIHVTVIELKGGQIMAHRLIIGEFAICYQLPYQCRSECFGTGTNSKQGLRGYGLFGIEIFDPKPFGIDHLVFFHYGHCEASTFPIA